MNESIMVQSDMPQMNPILLGILVLLGIGSLVCAVIQIINAFKKEQSPLLGILSIVFCGLGGFIIGWVKAKQWGIQKIMMIWTALVVLQVIVQVIAMSTMAAAAGSVGP